MTFLKTLPAIAFLFLAPVCQAQTLLNTDPVSPVTTINQLDITFTTGGVSDTQTVNILSGSQVDIDPTFTGGALQTLSHGGGQLSFSDATFVLGFGFFGSLQIDTVGLGATLTSATLPVIDDGSFGGSYDLINQNLTFNQGTITFSGLQAGSLDFGASPELLNLSATPTDVVTTDLLNGFHELVNTIVLDSIDTIVFNGIDVDVGVEGTAVSRGSIDSALLTAVPEPNSGLLLAMTFGYLATKRRRKR